MSQNFHEKLLHRGGKDSPFQLQNSCVIECLLALVTVVTYMNTSLYLS